MVLNFLILLKSNPGLSVILYNFQSLMSFIHFYPSHKIVTFTTTLLPLNFNTFNTSKEKIVGKFLGKEIKFSSCFRGLDTEDISGVAGG